VLVVRFNALAFYAMIMLYYDSAVNDWEFRANGNSTGLQYICDGGSYSVSGYDMNFDWHILVGVYDSGQASLYIDGAQYGASGSPGNAPMSGHSLWLGQRSDGYAFDGDIAASLMVLADLSAADRQNIEGYLANKYGLTANLPANHPFKNSPPLLPTRAGAGVLMIGL
jgi:Concanavalin A-like lectin/glucanases superfamily